MELLCDSRHGVYIPQIMARRLYDAAADRSAERGIEYGVIRIW